LTFTHSRKTAQIARHLALLYLPTLRAAAVNNSSDGRRSRGPDFQSPIGQPVKFAKSELFGWTKGEWE